MCVVAKDRVTELQCYLDRVERYSPDTLLGIQHKPPGWFFLLKWSNCVFWFGNLWSTAGSRGTRFPRVPIGHLGAETWFCLWSEPNLQPELEIRGVNFYIQPVEFQNSKFNKQVSVWSWRGFKHQICSCWATRLGSSWLWNVLNTPDHEMSYCTEPCYTTQWKKGKSGPWLQIKGHRLQHFPRQTQQTACYETIINEVRCGSSWASKVHAQAPTVTNYLHVNPKPLRGFQTQPVKTSTSTHYFKAEQLQTHNVDDFN